MAIYKSLLKLWQTLPTSWDDAAKNAVKHASQSVKIFDLSTSGTKGTKDGDSIKEYRVNVKITFSE